MTGFEALLLVLVMLGVILAGIGARFAWAAHQRAGEMLKTLASSTRYYTPDSHSSQAQRALDAVRAAPKNTKHT